jgi:signal transduction histidine kinase
LGEEVPPSVPVAVQTARPNLTGSVHAKNGGAVAATVFIATAGPKVGTSPFCPSCYADCQKSAKTDAAGSFEISSLDPQLRFQVLAVAKGFKPKYANKVDPAKGPIKVTLDPIELADAAPGNCLHGRIKDAKGKPVVGAVVEAHGIRTRNGGGRWGSLPGVDPLAVTDESGDFLITSQKPFDQMDVRVSARGFANKNFTELASGASVHALTLTEGAAVRGRVLFNGQPVTNVTVGVVSVNRDMEHFTGNFAAVMTATRQVARRRDRRRIELLEQRNALDQERMRIARDLHDHMGASLTEISLLGDLIGNAAKPVEETRQRAGAMKSKAQEMVRSMDEIVWAVNPRNDSLPSLATYIHHFAADFFSARPIRCRLDIMPNLPNFPLSVQIRHNLFLAVREALNNVAKHSRASEVWIRIRCENEFLAVVVEDDGGGLDVAKLVTQRSGLKNMRSRLADLGGRCEFENRPGGGLRVRFSLTVSPAKADK